MNHVTVMIRQPIKHDLTTYMLVQGTGPKTDGKAARVRKVQATPDKTSTPQKSPDPKRAKPISPEIEPKSLDLSGNDGGRATENVCPQHDGDVSAVGGHALQHDQLVATTSGAAPEQSSEAAAATWLTKLPAEG